MENITLVNGIEMPRLFQGLPIIKGLVNLSKQDFIKVVENTVSCGICGFDTSHEYGKSEEYLKFAIRQLKNNGIPREKLFIVSKIGNGQQIDGDIEKCVDQSLKRIGLDTLDLMLLHWPLPDYYIENWGKLIEVYKKGKVRAIGIANAKIRHLEQLKKYYDDFLPMVLQTEIHPFNTCDELRDYCRKNDIAIQACTSLLKMTDKVKNNKTLKEISLLTGMSIPQLMLIWSINMGISPIFRSFNIAHLKEIGNLPEKILTDELIQKISSLNEGYRYHPESMNCPGF